MSLSFQGSSIGLYFFLGSLVALVLLELLLSVNCSQRMPLSLCSQKDQHALKNINSIWTLGSFLILIYMICLRRGLVMTQDILLYLMLQRSCQAESQRLWKSSSLRTSITLNRKYTSSPPFVYATLINHRPFFFIIFKKIIIQLLLKAFIGLSHSVNKKLVKYKCIVGLFLYDLTSPQENYSVHLANTSAYDIYIKYYTLTLAI